MNYLIDGHNLIGKIADIDLSDPDDELKLIARLRTWAAGSSKRRVTVVFDHGLIGGKATHLSTQAVTVIFAPAGRIADTLIIQRIKRIANPAEYKIVSSDWAIIREAQERRVAHIFSEVFAKQMEEEATAYRTHTTPSPPSRAENPEVSADEVAEWMDLFGPVPDYKPSPRPRPAKPTPLSDTSITPPPSPPKRPVTVDELKSGDGSLDEAELAEWLAIFDALPPVPPTPKPTPAAQDKKKSPPGRDPETLRTNKRGDDVLSEEDIALWMQLFGDDASE